MSGLNDNHRRVLGSAFGHIDGLLVDIETAAANTSSPFARFRGDLAPAQQQVISDHVAHIRTRMMDALKALEIRIEPPRNASSWAIMTTLAFAEIAVQEITPPKLQGYGSLDAESVEVIERLEADLERSLRRLRSYVAQGLGKDLAARLDRLEHERPDFRLLRPLERIVRARGLIEFQGALESLLERLETRTFEIAVFGRVSSGKSSLLNAVLGIAALPVGVTPVTAVPTRVTWGEEAVAEIRFADTPEERVSLDRLPEFVSEAGNSGNRKHVVRALVRLQSPKLAEGVVFVDTPGVGSLATAGARESYAYLPRCDLGILLLDSASSVDAEDLEILRLLYDSGIPGMAVLSKADLLSGPDRDRMKDYVQRQIAERLGLDLRVHLVSTAGADAALAGDWFEREIAPLCARARELAETSARRKLASLRQSVAASLRVSLGSASREDSERQERRRAGVEDLALEAEGLLQEAARKCEHFADQARGLARPALAAAAAEIAGEAPGPGGSKSSPSEAVGGTLRRCASEIREGVRDELVRTRDRLRTSRAEMASEVPGVEAHPQEVRVELVTEPMLTIPAEADHLEPIRIGWLKPFPTLLERRIGAELIARLDGPVSRVCWTFSRELRDWLQKTLGALAAQFSAQSEPLRAQARRIAEGSGEADRERIESDLAEIEQPVETSALRR